MPPFTNLATFAPLRRSVATYAITAINNCMSVVWKSSLAQDTLSVRPRKKIMENARKDQTNWTEANFQSRNSSVYSRLFTYLLFLFKLFYASIIKRLRAARASLMEIYVNPRPVITLVINSRDYRVSRSPPGQDSFAGIFFM